MGLLSELFCIPVAKQEDAPLIRADLLVGSKDPKHLLMLFLKVVECLVPGIFFNFCFF